MDEITDEESDLISQLTTIETDLDKIVAAVKLLPSKLLHIFCMYYEQVSEVAPLLAALESQQCDRATATLIYWTSDPLRFSGKQTVFEGEAREFELFRSAETRLLNGTLPRRRFKFDPVSELGYDTVYWQSVRSNPHIPAKLKPKIEAFDFLPQWLLFRTFETIPGEKCRKVDCIEDRIKNSVLCRAHHFEMIYKQLPPNQEK